MAKAQDASFQQVLVRFALERLLYRLSLSNHADRFVLKGALLFTLWYDMQHRATRDADFLGFGASDLESVKRVFEEIVAVSAEDGIVFDATAVSVGEIRKETGYGGVRVVIPAELDRARCKAQIDIGFGDAVTLEAERGTFPVLLEDLPAPRIRTYPMYTAIAEKIHAIAELGATNTRMKDFFDLYVLQEREVLDEGLLAQAIRATFARRGTPLAGALPFGLTDAFVGSSRISVGEMEAEIGV